MTVEPGVSRCPLLNDFLPSLAPNTLLLLMIAGTLAGLVRGFSGFGSAMVFMPFASTLVDPRLAATSFLFVDWIAGLPIAARAVGICDWKTVLPAIIGSAVVVPFGAWVLAAGDPLLLRWVISLASLLLLGLLASGWRYRGAPRWPISMGVGGISGFVGGVALVGGPPMVAYWMSGPAASAVIRANLIVFFVLSSFGFVLAYWWHDLITAESGWLLATILPTHILGIMVGIRLFRHATESTYRRVAIALIAVTAISSLPLFDPVLR